MMTLFSINIKGKEFSLRGVANVAKQTAKWQAIEDGKVFAEDADYERVRVLIVEKVAIERMNTRELH